LALMAEEMAYVRRPETEKKGKIIILKIPLSAIPKERPRLGKYGNVYPPDKTRIFEESFRFLAGQQLRQTPPLQGRLSVEIILGEKETMVSAREIEDNGSIVTGDVTNLAKSVEDALNKVLWKDDSQIDFLLAKR